MTSNELIEHVKTSFENAELGKSKLTNELLQLDGMTGNKTRHLYNNLLNTQGTRYLEIGTWKGSSVCSAMFGNTATVVCIDNWSAFGGPKDEFLVNYNKFKGLNNATFIEEDCFTVDISKLPKFNIYLYDGCHMQESHTKALIHYYNCLDDTFIYIVDDWNWDFVRNGTFDAFKQLKLEILFEKEIRLTFDNSHTPYPLARDTWHNGIYVAVLRKTDNDALSNDK